MTCPTIVLVGEKSPEDESTSDTEDAAENQGNAADAVAGNSSTSGG
jgi:hypothetical protein